MWDDMDFTNNYIGNDNYTTSAMFAGAMFGYDPLHFYNQNNSGYVIQEIGLVSSSSNFTSESQNLVDHLIAPEQSINCDRVIENNTNYHFKSSVHDLREDQQNVEIGKNLNVENISQENVSASNSSTANLPVNNINIPQSINITDSEEVTPTSSKKDHVVLPPCKKCRLKCSDYFSSDCREEQNNVFWKLNWMERRVYITKHVKKEEIKRRRVNEVKFQRNNQYCYFMVDDAGEERQVCKPFFLATLGFKQSNDSIVRNTMKEIDPITLMPKPDHRGKKKSQSTEIRNLKIVEHVESFNPSVSHYRRAHAPNRRYLPSTLSITIMYNDFKENNPDESICYETYRSVFDKMNIAVTKLGHEECESCERFNVHGHDKDNLNDECDICKEWSTHNARAAQAREKYMKHVKEVSDFPDTAYYCADLQKVIMLPRMDSLKVCMFTKRIVAFNESIVPLGSFKRNHVPFAALWHEGIAGRKKEQIISAFHSFFLTYRDVKRFVIWFDNCSGQNKNWAFFTFLIYLVNSEEVDANFIEINYFESGHTFMAADSFHHRVEESMKNMGKIYDFKDFEQAVQNSTTGKVLVKSLNFFDFSSWADHSSKQKLKSLGDVRPYLNDIKQVRVVRGSYKMQYNLTYEEIENLEELDFLKVQVTRNGIPAPVVQAEPRGIPLQKKENIIKKLVPLMKPNRRRFWNNLQVSNVADLIDEYDNEY